MGHIEVRSPTEKKVFKDEFLYSGIELGHEGNETGYVSFITTFEELEECVGDGPLFRNLNLFIPHTHLGENNIFDDDHPDGQIAYVEGIVFQGRKNRVRFVNIEVNKEQAKVLRKWTRESAECIRQNGAKKYLCGDKSYEQRKEAVKKAGEGAL